MKPSEAPLIAYVRFPPLQSFPISIKGYVRQVMVNHPMEILSIWINRSTPLLHQLSEWFASIILENIDPILSDWMLKDAPMFQLVDSTSCFFGIDEDYVLENMKEILPQLFPKAFSYTKDLRCTSLDQLIRVVAKEVTAKVNFKIIVSMTSMKLYQRCPAYNCECLSYITMYSMINLLPKILRCGLMNKCRGCLPQAETPQLATTTTFLHGNQQEFFPIRRGRCEVLYSTHDKALWDILVENCNLSLSSFEDFGSLPEEEDKTDSSRNPVSRFFSRLAKAIRRSFKNCFP